MPRESRPIIMLRGPLKGQVLHDLPWAQAESEVEMGFAAWVEEGSAAPAVPPPAAKSRRRG